MAQGDAGDFSLIIAEVEGERLAEAAKKFAQAFSLDESLAQQICKSSPILFAQKLTKAEVKAITPKLAELSAEGMEFRVTARPTGKIPKVNWPVRPQFTAGDSGGPNGLAFEWDNSAFVCPGCGETFLFRRLGKLKLGSAEVAEYAPAPEPVANPVGESDSDMKADIESFPESAPTETAPETVTEDPALELKPDDASPEAEAPVEMPFEPEVEPELAVEEIAAEPVATLEEGGGEFSAAADEAQVQTEAPAEAGGEVYNVFLSKITDASKRDKAAELIGKVKGCSGNEAKELTTRLVIPLAKNVSKVKAEDILNAFKKLKIFGRMTKVK